MLDNGSHWSTGTFCPVGRFVPWDVLSMGHCVRGTFCPLDVLSVERFVLGRFVLGRFVLGRFVLGRFVCASKFVLLKVLVKIKNNV